MGKYADDVCCDDVRNSEQIVRPFLKDTNMAFILESIFNKHYIVVWNFSEFYHK